MHAQSTRDPYRSCYTCQHFGRDEPASGTVWCACPGNEYRRSRPENGCSMWVREPGTDDDLPGRIRELIAEGRW